MEGAASASLVGKADDTLATVTRSRLPRAAANADGFDTAREARSLWHRTPRFVAGAG